MWTSGPTDGERSDSGATTSTRSSSGVRSLAMRGRDEGSLFFDRTRRRWVAKVSMPDGTRRTRLAPASAVTKKDARPTLVALLADRDAMRDPDARTPLGPFLQRWLADAAPGLRPSTLRTYRQIVNDHLVPALGRTPVALLTPAMVSGYLRRTGEKVSPQTVVHHRAVLRAALAMGMRWGILTRNVAALADVPRVVRRPLEVLDAPQVRQLLDGTVDARFHAVWAVAATTGMRQAEILGLTWRDIDLDGARLRVERTLAKQGGAWVLVEPKTTQSRRTIPLTPTAVSALRSRKRQMREEWLAAGRPGDEFEAQLAFQTDAGQPLTGSVVTKALQRTLADLGLPRLRFHDLRHGTATILLADGWALEDVKNLLGHSTIALTSNTYGHYLERRGREVAAGMEKALGGRS
jgi:integrase